MIKIELTEDQLNMVIQCIEAVNIKAKDAEFFVELIKTLRNFENKDSIDAVA